MHSSRSTTAPPLRDPAERWELPCTESEGTSYFRGIYEVFPRTPRREEDVPAEARESLAESCRITSIRQLFLIPWAVRSTGLEDQKVASPGAVLALGTRAVGLWTEKPEPGVKVVIPLDRLAAIEDVTVLLYGRLRFVSFDETLTIRYNTLARSGLRPALLELRERLSGSPQQLPRDEPPAPHLPLKWKRLLRGPVARFREDTPVAFRFATETSASGDEVGRGQLLVINPHELVYLCDPREASHNYGEDSFIVPRPRITRVRVRERYLEVASNGARLCLDMAPELRQAAAHWLG
jgi:hypothetical protein